MWIGDDLLASATRLTEGRRVGRHLSRLAGPPACGGRGRPLAAAASGSVRADLGGAKTGAYWTDRRKLGSKRDVITAASGVPLAVVLSGSNGHDVTQLLPLVEAIPSIAGKPARPIQGPRDLYGDGGCESQPHRIILSCYGIEPQIARRSTVDGTGLGVNRWVAKRTISWLHQSRRLRIRYDRRSNIHEALLKIGCIIICWDVLNHESC